MKKKTGNQNGLKSVIRPRSAAASKSKVPTWHKVFAIQLRRKQADRHITLETLARKTGLTLEFVKKAARGENPKLVLAHVEVFAQALGVTAIYLLKRRRSKGA